MERFIPASILDNLKRKEIRKLLSHFLKLHSNMTGSGKQLTSLQVKLHYLDITSQLPSYGAKCFSAGPKGDIMEKVILVSPKFGISQIMGHRNSVVRSIFFLILVWIILLLYYTYYGSNTKVAFLYNLTKLQQLLAVVRNTKNVYNFLNI